MAGRLSRTDALRRRAGRALRDALPARPVAAGRAAPLQPVAGAPVFGVAARGRAIQSGEWRWGGASVEVGPSGHPFSVVLPSERFAGWVHGFSWLDDLLSAAGGADAAKALAINWVEAFPAKSANSFVFAPDRLAERLFHWGAAFDALSGPRGTVADSYAVQMRRLRAALRQVSPGIAALRAQAALVLYGARLSDKSDGWLDRGLDGLDAALVKQVLPDGGHVSRSPEATLDALHVALVADAVLQARGLAGSPTLGRAIDRLAPMVATLRHADGGLGVFHGGGEGEPARIDAMLDASPGETQSFAYGPHTGFHRLEAGGTVVLADTQSVPPRPFDTRAHLAPLALEMSTAEGRLIVNCGWSEGASPQWHRPVRSAAAHSTLILGERSPGAIAESGLLFDAFGPAVVSAAEDVRARRKEQVSGIWLETSHDGYKESQGLVHRRRLFMGEDGDDFRGEDSLLVPLGDAPLHRERIPFALRFHFHPDVRVSLAQDLSSALLVQKGRAGWRFRTDGGPLAVEPSVYLGGGAPPVRAQQLVIRGQAYADGDGQGRDNRVRWSLRRLRPREGGAA